MGNPWLMVGFNGFFDGFRYRASISEQNKKNSCNFVEKMAEIFAFQVSGTYF